VHSDSKQLCVTPIDGSKAPCALTPQEDAEEYIASFLLSPDGECVVYLAASSPSSRLGELFAVKTNGRSSPIRLTGPGEYPRFEIGPHGRVVFIEGNAGLFSVPIDGSTPPVRLNTENEYIPGRPFLFTPGGDFLLYVELYRVPSDGTASPVKLSGPSRPAATCCRASGSAPTASGRSMWPTP